MKKKLMFYGALLFLVGCGVSQQVVYERLSVEEEGGIKFTPYTTENENVVAPIVVKDEISGMLKWYAAPLLAVSPNGEQITYIAESNGYKNLYIKEISGGSKKIQRTFNKNIMDMSYSPDGTKISFTEDKGGDFNINMINATQGVAVRQVTATSETELGPIFSPDGESIYYTVQEGNRFYVWNISLETTLKTQYSEGFTPVLTPDGTKLIVTRNSKDSGFGEIWEIDLIKGTETQLLSSPDVGYSSPAISPDGKYITVVGVTLKSDTRPQNLDVYVMKADGTALTQLTFHGGNDVSPIWSSDGKSLFFLSQRGNAKGKFNVWKMDFKL